MGRFPARNASERMPSASVTRAETIGGAAIACLLVALLAAAPVPARALSSKYLYQLSDSNGPVFSSWASLAYDTEHKELYVVDRQDGTVGIFNEVGMEVYRFGQDSDIGTISSLTVLDGGDLLVLAADKGRPVIHRCNFRGEPKERIELSDLPPDFAKDFWPDTIIYRAGSLYLAEKGSLRVVVANASGKCVAAYDFFRKLGFDKTKTARGGAPAMHTFNVDAEGYMLFSVAAMFKVYVVSPDGKVDSFGERGGAPGKFNIAGGVARDERGYIYVSDVLKSAILVFNERYQFLGQFGERGWDRSDLIAPLEIAAAGGKLFVSQSARKGVSVFEVEVP
jgi:DNA-binding beta-propeller fold protein YncE